MRKKCVKGKSCGASCISKAKVCLKDVAPDVAKSLKKAKEDVEGVKKPPKPTTATATTATKPPTSPTPKKSNGTIAEIEDTLVKLEKSLQDKNIDEALKLLKKGMALAETLPEPDRRRQIDNIDLLTGRVSLGLKTDKAADFKEAGKDTMKRYGAITSSLSILRKIKELETYVQKQAKDWDSVPVKERLRMKKRMTRLWERRARIEAKLKKAMGDLREEMLVPKVPQSVLDRAVGRVRIDPSFSPGKRTELRETLAEFAKMFNGRGMGDEFKSDDPNNPRGIRMVEIKTTSSNRASADPFRGKVSIGEGSNRVTIFHEFAHLLESQYPQILNFAEGWRNSKALPMAEVRKLYPGADTPSMTVAPGVKMPVVKLKDMLPSSGYGGSEFALAGNYLYHYMGKVYPSAGFPKSTEVISMGVEMMSSVPRMIELYRAHPDLFEYLVGMAVSP